LAFHTKPRPEIEGVWEQGAEENVLAQEEGCRRLHNEELHNLYASKNIVRVTKSRRMRGCGM